MSNDDPKLPWSEANPFGIQTSSENDAWNTGRCLDVLPIGGDNVLVAGESNGVWSVTSRGQALPLSDAWEIPSVNSLEFGPDGPDHVFAGGGDAAPLQLPLGGVSWSSDRIDLFAIGFARQLWRLVNDGNWEPWEPLGGEFVGKATVVSWAQGRIDVFAGGLDGTVYHKAFDGGAWSPGKLDWDSLGQPPAGFASDAPGAAATAVGQLEVMVIGIDGALYRKRGDGARWQPSAPGDWQKLGSPPGTTLVGSPVLVSVGTLHVLARGADHAIYDGLLDGAGSVAWQPLGGTTDDPIAAVTTEKGRIDLLARINGQLAHRFFDGTQWRPWSTIGGPCVGAPAAVAADADRVDVFVRGTDGACKHKWFDAGSWQPGETDYEDLSGVLASVPIATAWPNKQLDVFVVGTDGNLYHRWRSAGDTKWNPDQNNWENLGLSIRGALHATDVTQGFPLLSWVDIPLPDAVQVIHQVAVMTDERRIVLACDGGVYWSPIPQSGGSYAWKSATGLPGGPFFSVCVGRFLDGDSGQNGIVAGGLSFNGIWYGKFQRGDLAFQKSGTLLGLSQMMRSAVSSCPNDRTRVYATVANGQGQLLAVLSSTDGGRTFLFTNSKIAGTPGADISDPRISGDEDSGGAHKTIHVSGDPQTFAFAWRQPFLTTDAGNWWTAVGWTWDSNQNKLVPTPARAAGHLHNDIHAVRFDPNHPMRFFVASDGGVAFTSDGGQTFTSVYSSQLRTQQMYSRWVRRNFYGTTGASPAVIALVGAGLQDNGNQFSIVTPASPWRALDGNDGGLVLFIATGQVLHNDTGTNAVRVSRWNGNGFDGNDQIQIRGGGLSGAISSYSVDVVRKPHFKNRAGQFMYAAAGANTNQLFGLFANSDGGDIHWELLSTLQQLDKKSGITAVASPNGLTVFVGTQGGRMLVFDTRSASTLELGVHVPAHIASGDPRASISHIASLQEQSTYAVYNIWPGAGYVLRVDSLRFSALATGLPGDDFFALEVDDRETVYVATDDRVYVSRDRGETWQQGSLNLPRRAHGGDLRYVEQINGAQYMYLGTYGRSMWKSRLDTGALQSGVCALIQSDYASGQHGNFEVLVLEGQRLIHYYHDNSDVNLPWGRGAVVSTAASGPAGLIQSNFPLGADHGNFEAVVLEGNQLVHYWRDNQDPSQPWHRGAVITSNAVGPGCIIQSDYSDGKHGNFEVLVPESDGLKHYWRDNSIDGQPWHFGGVVSPTSTASASLIQSNFPFGADHGNFDAVVLERTQLVHYWRDNSDPAKPWDRGVMITDGATGPGCIIQSDFSDGRHGNFEVVVPLGSQGLVHFWRDNSVDGLPWHRAQVVAPGATGPATLIQSNFGSGSHGNFEVAVAEGNRLVHHWHDNSDVNLPWAQGQVIETFE